MTVARVHGYVTYPARLQLVAAMNPCRCGDLAELACARAPRCAEEYQARLSGPLLEGRGFVFQISDHVVRFRDRLVAMPLEMPACGSVNVGIRDHHDQAVSDFRRLRIAVAANHSFSFDHRRRPETLRTAMATAFFWPTRTTRRLPRVTPV